MNSYYSKAIYLSNQWKTVFIFTILTIVVIDGTFATSSITSSQKSSDSSKKSGNNSPTSKWMIDNNNYNLKAFDQHNGIRDLKHVTPIPSWSSEVKPPLIFATEQQYEEFVQFAEPILKQMFKETVYDKISNMIDFYEKFKSINATKPMKLSEFYKMYDIQVNRRVHNCVTMSMEIIERLCAKRPQLNNNFYLVSCKEKIESYEKYISDFNHLGTDQTDQTLNVNHVLAAARILVANREGVMLFDNGYNIAQAITVMKDGKSPHRDSIYRLTSEYNYEFSKSNDGFIECTKNGVKNGLIYVKTPYQTAVDVSVRQTLVSDFQAIVKRDDHGNNPAALYFLVGESGEYSEFTFFYPQENGRSSTFVEKCSFFKDSKKIPSEYVPRLKRFADEIGYTEERFHKLLEMIYKILTDSDFIKQMISTSKIIHKK